MIACLFTLVGCTAKSSGPNSDGKIRILATTGMVGDLARRVGGDKVDVQVLMGPGVDPHLYKASPGDVSKINAADWVLYNGLHLEGKMGEIFESVARKKPTLAVAERVNPDLLLKALPGMSTVANAPDPHVWFDVELWASNLDGLALFFAEHDAANAEFYRENARKYREELEALHRDVKARIAEIPENRRVLITAHDAFRYFGRAYDIEVRGIQGISTESEAGVAEIVALVDLMAKRQIPAVFVESSVSQKNVQALIEGARRKGVDARIGGSLFSDAMGAAGSPEGTYPGMIRHNVEQIVSGLKASPQP